jgi:sensory rhodopsin
MAQFIAAAAPRMIIPSFFVSQKVKTMTDPVAISQTVAFSSLFVSAVFNIFTPTPWIGLIPGIAAYAYWKMQQDPANTNLYRYTDWALTTPLILIALLSVNNYSVKSIAGLVALDLLMIASGYMGINESDPTKKQLWFALGCAAFLPILYALWNTKVAKWAVLLTLVLWTIYPIVWELNQEQRLSEQSTSIAYSAMDVCAKVGLVTLLHV